MFPNILCAERWQRREQRKRIIAPSEPCSGKVIGTSKTTVRECGDHCGIGAHAMLCQRRLNVRRGERAKRNVHRTRADRRQERIIGTSHKDEQDLSERFLECLEQTVRRLIVHTLRPVDEDDAPRRQHRRGGCLHENIPYRIRADHRRTLAAHFRHGLEIIGMHPCRHCPTSFAVTTGGITARCAEQCPREHARRAPLTDPRRPRKDQRVGQPPPGYEPAQTADYFRMPAHILPAMREDFPCGRFFRRRLFPARFCRHHI